MKHLQQFVLIDIQWNAWNGFYFQLLTIEHHKWDQERSLLSFWTNWKDHLCVDFLFIKFNNRKDDF